MNVKILPRSSRVRSSRARLSSFLPLRTPATQAILYMEDTEQRGPGIENRADRTGLTEKKRSTSKGGPLFSKLFRLDRTDPLSFRPKFPDILVEWIAPMVYYVYATIGKLARIEHFETKVQMLR